MKLRAFTMAEVLITLGVIGIVAAMTLPTIITSNRHKVLESHLKKSYSVIAQALDMYQAENEVKLTPAWIPRSTTPGEWNEVKQILMKYLNVSKDCGMGSESGASISKTCIPNYVNYDRNENNPEIEDRKNNYKNYNKSNEISLGKFDDGQFVTNDGTLILLDLSNKQRFYISVDVNGYNKRPNILGQDLFMFQVNEKGDLLPMGVKNTDYYSETNEYCSYTSTDPMNGAGCTYKALNDKEFFKNLP